MSLGGTMTSKNTLNRLYQDIPLADLSRKMAAKEGYGVEDVQGKGVNVDGSQGTNLGVTRFDWKKIFVPTYLPKALRDYVLGHEAFVEAYGRPSGERDHADKEMEYLQDLKRDGYMNEYVAGIAMHYLRNKSGNTRPFRWIKSYVDKAVSEYKDSELFKQNVEDIDSVLRDKKSPGYKPSMVDKGYKMSESAINKGYTLGKEISEKGGIGKYIMNWAGEKLDKVAAKYKPVMKPAMEVG